MYCLQSFCLHSS